jgi:hypothetical protein
VGLYLGAEVLSTRFAILDLSPRGLSYYQHH